MTSAALAARTAANRWHAVRVTTRSMRESRLSSPSTILQLSAVAQASAYTTGDHTEVVDSFANGLQLQRGRDELTFACWRMAMRGRD
jgi:hypothetical protein